jgi:hypothetical protein
VRSNNNANTAAHCLHFNVKTEDELKPERDLGSCDVKGKRNLLGDRAYGTPSIRSDLPRPSIGNRSVANIRNYGDDVGTAALLHPQRFQALGVSDDHFLELRTRTDMHGLLTSAGLAIDDATFARVWAATTSVGTASIKDFLQAYCQVVVDAQVAARFNT